MQQHVYAISQTCKAHGITHAIICPGSRSAPLVYAFTQEEIHCESIVDERSAAYIAIGMAQQLQKPVALICTSGTAALNFYPAIAEAFFQKIPLLVLTADRPPHLLHQQDGQMINQKNVFEKNILGSYEIPCYAIGTENFQETVTITQEAIANAISNSGPVHINIPLQEPLYPKPNAKIPSALKYIKPLIINHSENIADATQKELTTIWKKYNRKLLLIGQMPNNAELTAALIELQQHEDLTIICDVLSNQFQFNTAAQFDYLLMRADTQLLAQLEPDCIISLGGPILSKSLKQWLQKCKPNTHIRFNSNNTKIDTYQNVTRHIKGNPASWLKNMAVQLPKVDSKYKLWWQSANAIIAQSTDTFFANNRWNELSAMKQLLNKIPTAANIQIGNSSVIRYISYLGNINPSWVMNGNRGTSGIDGCTSTAVGAAQINNRPTILLTGDIAFLYDINALWNSAPHNLKIIVFNNEGGGIFQLINGPTLHSKQLHYFTTPHQQNIKQIAQLKGLDYYTCSSPNDLKVLNTFFEPSNNACLLELKFDRDKNANTFNLFKKITL